MNAVPLPDSIAISTPVKIKKLKPEDSLIWKQKYFP